MAGDWRDHVETKSWERINHWELSADDKDELRAILAARVPKVKRGEGLDTFLEYAQWGDLRSDELNEAAQLLEHLRGLPNYGGPAIYANWLESARCRAMEVAAEEGIWLIEDSGNLRDMNDIYVYFDRDGTPVELRKDIAIALMARCHIP